ncbi:APC family permease [Mycolicibacterium sp.]|uniref:APC family permease n=1 Tax=Mycolicibacterium sp. TaxID=2320850 RepID=UPI0037CAD991
MKEAHAVANSAHRVIDEPSRHRLRGRMGTLAVVFAVLAYNSPMVIMVGFVPVIIGVGNGLGAPLAFALNGLLLAVFATGFMCMTRRLESPGAFYSYITAGLGRPAGLAASFVALLGYGLILIGGLVFIGTAGQAFVRDTLGGNEYPTWLFSAVTVVVIGAVGYLNIDFSAKVLGALLAAEVVVIATYDAAIVWRGGRSGLHLESFTMSAFTSGSVGIALLLAMTCFAGFEATAVFRDEVRDPATTIPRATYLTIASIALLHTVGTWAVIQAVGPNSAVSMMSADPANGFLDTTREYLGTVGVDVITALVLTSCLAGTLATQNICSRYIFNLAADGILPGRFGRVHRRHGSPARASVLVSAVVVAAMIALTMCAGNDPTLYAKTTGMGGYAILVLILVTSLAVVVWLNRWARRDLSTFRRLVLPTVAAAGLAFVVGLATVNLDLLVGGTTAAAWGFLSGLVILAGATACYAGWLRREKPTAYARIGRQQV